MPVEYARRLVPLIETWNRHGARVAIFGVGPHTDLLFRVVPQLSTVDLVGFLDNDTGRQGTLVRGQRVHSPAWATGHADVILCSSFLHEQDMAAAVASTGCDVVLSHEGHAPVAAPPHDAFHRHDARWAGRGPDLRVQARCAVPPVEPGRFDIVVLPIIDWHYRFQRPQQLAQQFAGLGHRLYYVRNTFHGGRQAKTRLLGDRLFEVTLPAARPVDIYGESMDARVLDGFVSAIERLAVDQGLVDVVCLVDLPFWWPLASDMRQRLAWKVVYDCMDEHRGFARTGDVMLANEAALVAESDLVVASSHPLAARLGANARRCELVPNGVDFAHFAFPIGPPPAALASLPRPLVGYYGAVADWFDTDLVARLADERPSWGFLVIGNTSGADISALTDRPNVTLWPEQPYESLPAILRAFDVGIIPFRPSTLTHATNPVKLYEYWAGGKPVVATRLAELQRFEPDVRLAETVPEWLEALETSLSRESQGAAAVRRAIATRHTWQGRAGVLEQLCQSLFVTVSVVIVTKDAVDLTRRCIDSLLKARYPSLELIISDNASTDGTVDYLRGIARNVPWVRLLETGADIGFAEAANRGAAAAGGDVLVFLEPDVYAPREWLSRLVGHIAGKDDRIVVPTITGATGTVVYRTTDEFEVFSHRRSARLAGRARQARPAAPAGMALTRATLGRLGPLEPGPAGRLVYGAYVRHALATGLACAVAEDVLLHDSSGV
jgi:glycosyltransferase involved in cell wall biosynthesis